MTTISKDHILIFTTEEQVNYLLERMLLSMGYTVALCDDYPSARESIKNQVPALIILGEKVEGGNGLDYALELTRVLPSAGMIYLVKEENPETLKNAMRAGINDYLCLPLKADDILKAVQASMERARQRKEWVLLEAKRATVNLQRRVDELETLARLGRTITGSLALDNVLSLIVDAAVELTAAEEGCLLLLDEASGELYMRASRNFQDDFVKTFRLPIQDTLAGTVLRTGNPVLLDESTPQKIKTSYLVQSLIYVPLQLGGHTIGVLGVDNRHERPPFKDKDVKMLSAVAEYAVIAIENARIYDENEQARSKLETILTNINDGVIVMDNDHHLLMANRAAFSIFNLNDEDHTGRKFEEIFNIPDLIQLVDLNNAAMASRAEITTENGSTYNAHVAPIEHVGLAVTLNDITYLKKLDQIKSEFVSTVSHDLRSPLTAILGYVELIERAGEVTPLQHDFIERVQNSVRNITKLVDDLLNLGRIESGFDSRKEAVSLDQLVRYAAEELLPAANEKRQEVTIDIPAPISSFFANPVQIRQMVHNLMDNAIKYSPEGNKIDLRAVVEYNQVIIQISDQGIGIPPADLPFLFDKFYRGGNSLEVSGTGLGLAIVKSIVEGHGGRIWVESLLGKGSTFTVVLPVEQG
ncbi:MAG: GAF domain-containing protein [Anaerolineae bacterium]|nr:GAF domain-containing protein [Anaerolineae bacterium]